MVMGVLNQAFDVLVLRYGVQKRVYCNVSAGLLGSRDALGPREESGCSGLIEDVLGPREESGCCGLNQDALGPRGVRMGRGTGPTRPGTVHGGWTIPGQSRIQRPPGQAGRLPGRLRPPPPEGLSGPCCSKSRAGRACFHLPSPF